MAQLKFSYRMSVLRRVQSADAGAGKRCLSGPGCRELSSLRLPTIIISFRFIVADCRRFGRMGGTDGAERRPYLEMPEANDCRWKHGPE
jgi:hypothetical protein